MNALAAVVLGGMLLIGIWETASTWRYPVARRPMAPPTWWPSSPAAWHGVRRTEFPQLTWLLALLIGAWGPTAWVPGALAAFILSVGGCIWMFLFASPRWLHPPALRGQPGYLEFRRRHPDNEQPSPDGRDR